MTPRHRHIASALVVIGSALVAIVALPIGFSTLHFRFFSPKTLIDPTAVGLYPRPKIINVLGLTTSDYTSPVSWFPSAPIDPAATPSSRVRYYTLTIPSLSLHDIPVEISGSDLTKNAIQFPNTALPSQVGNTVILGHSSLPGLYKKGSPQVIFNPLPNIKIGAEVVIKFDGITYRYLVKDTKEVTPDRIDVLAPVANRRQLTLVTCVPLGTYWRRFIATAYLVN